MPDNFFMPDPERLDKYVVLEPGFKKVYLFGHVLGPWPFNDGYIIADSWEDAYEELLYYAYEKDGECDHGDPPELRELIAAAGRAIPHDDQDEWEACWRWVEEHCDCDSAPNGGYVWMVDRWWHRETDIKPNDLLRALGRDEEEMYD